MVNNDLVAEVRGIVRTLEGGLRDEWRAENGWTFDESRDEWVNSEGWSADDAGAEIDYADNGPMPDNGWESYWVENHVLEFEYRVASDYELRGTRALVTVGGPNIWVDFGRDFVEGHWAGDSFTDSFVDEFGIGDYFAEYFALS